MCLSVYMSVCISVSVYLFVYVYHPSRSVYLSICLSILPIYLSFLAVDLKYLSPSTAIFIYLPIQLYIEQLQVFLGQQLLVASGEYYFEGKV